jgi:hypothetical protein
MIFWKKYVPSDEIKLRDEITGFDGTIHKTWRPLDRDCGNTTCSIGMRLI